MNELYNLKETKMSKKIEACILYLTHLHPQTLSSKEVSRNNSDNGYYCNAII